MSYEEFLAAPEFDNVLAEWVNGEVQVLPPPSIEHQIILGFLFGMIRLFLQEKFGDRGIVLFAPVQVKLGPGLSGREPDLLYVSEARMGRVRKNRLDGAPDLAVEITSPESARRDRLEKFEEYARAGVREYWLIDPEARKVGFYGLEADGRFSPIAMHSDGSLRSHVLPGLALLPEWIWRRPSPSMREILETWNRIESQQ